jgi:hypothetical protein
VVAGGAGARRPRRGDPRRVGEGARRNAEPLPRIGHALFRDKEGTREPQERSGEGPRRAMNVTRRRRSRTPTRCARARLRSCRWRR